MKRALVNFLVFIAMLGAAFADQGYPKKYLSAATTNSNLVRAGKTAVAAIVPVNTNATTYYLKLYDKATAPVCGTTCRFGLSRF